MRKYLYLNIYIYQIKFAYSTIVINDNLNDLQFLESI